MGLGVLPGPSGTDARTARFQSQTQDFQAQAGDRVFFSEGSAQLGTRAKAAIAAQAAWLARNPAVSVTIEGHADDQGSPGHNLALSERRAHAVRLELIGQGLAPQRIGIAAYGRERLVAECAGPLCAAQNRRTVTTLREAATRPARRDVLDRPPPRRLY